MTHYLPVVHELGFNAVWVNPLQRTGDISNFIKRDKNNGISQDNEVSHSLYAMSDPLQIDYQFSVASEDNTPDEAFELNRTALQLFTRTARELGLVPMFDLVLNHMALDTPLVREKPHWFKGVEANFNDVRGFNYEDEAIRKEILRDLWKPYIRRYMLDYGFDGVRVDAVGYVHPKVRQALHSYIQLLAIKHRKPKPVIFDEALFSTRPLIDEIQYLKSSGIGPTHITTEVYCVERELDGVLPRSVLMEERLKASIIFSRRDGSPRNGSKGGCVNFCGNHDYYSLAMTVLRQMAKHRCLLDPTYHLISQYYQATFPTTTAEYVLPESLVTALKFSYLNDIKKELSQFNKRTQEELETLLYDKIAVCALTGSGGWFLLSGDEIADITAKTVFQRKYATDPAYYPQREHGIFSIESSILNHVLETMAKDNFFIEYKENEQIKNLYHSIAHIPEIKRRFLASHTDNIKNQINAGIPKACNRFYHLLSSYGVFVSFHPSAYAPRPRGFENGWLGLHNNVDFIKQVNLIIQKLPASKAGFESELIRLAEKPNLVIVVRKNGSAINARIDIVVVNLDRQKTEALSLRDVHCIARQYCKQHFSSSTIDATYRLRVSTFDNIVQCFYRRRIHVDNRMFIDSSAFPAHKTDSTIHGFWARENTKLTNPGHMKATASSLFKQREKYNPLTATQSAPWRL